MKTQSKALTSLVSIAILYASQGLASAAEKDDPTTLQEFQEQTVVEESVTTRTAIIA